MFVSNFFCYNEAKGKWPVRYINKAWTSLEGILELYPVPCSGPLTVECFSSLWEQQRKEECSMGNGTFKQTNLSLY